MPIYVTVEQFTCGDSLETRQRHDGEDDVVLTEIIPVNMRCLQCICQDLLHHAIDGLPCIPRSRIAELEEHFDVLRNIDMDRHLEPVKAQVLQPTNADEFRTGILALAGFPLIKGRFIVGA